MLSYSGPPSVALRRSEDPVSAYHNEDSSVHRRLGVLEWLACCGSYNLPWVVCENHLVQEVPFVKAVRELSLQTQQQQGRELVEEIKTKQPAVHEEVEFMKQRRSLQRIKRLVLQTSKSRNNRRNSSKRRHIPK